VRWFFNAINLKLSPLSEHEQESQALFYRSEELKKKADIASQRAMLCKEQGKMKLNELKAFQKRGLLAPMERRREEKLKKETAVLARRAKSMEEGAQDLLNESVSMFKKARALLPKHPITREQRNYFKHLLELTRMKRSLESTLGREGFVNTLKGRPSTSSLSKKGTHQQETKALSQGAFHHEGLKASDLDLISKSTASRRPKAQSTASSFANNSRLSSSSSSSKYDFLPHYDMSENPTLLQSIFQSSSSSSLSLFLHLPSVHPINPLTFSSSSLDSYRDPQACTRQLLSSILSKDPLTSPAFLPQPLTMDFVPSQTTPSRKVRLKPLQDVKTQLAEEEKEDSRGFILSSRGSQRSTSRQQSRERRNSNSRQQSQTQKGGNSGTIQVTISKKKRKGK
jgi:hypothetical protein